MSMMSGISCHVNGVIRQLDASTTEHVAITAQARSTWTFLTNHTHVLICLAQDPTMRIRDIADRIGITERAAHRILSELTGAGYVSRVRDGRRNHYSRSLDHPLRHPLEASRPVRDLVEALATRSRPEEPA